MTPEILAGLISAFLAGVAVGLVLALVVIPGAVDAWSISRRHEPDGVRRRRRDR